MKDEFTPEQAMAALMSAYEKELQAPIKGIMFGNLTTAILIQMQKLKVHTEVAMLKMDQVFFSFFSFFLSFHIPGCYLRCLDFGVKRVDHCCHSRHASFWIHRWA